MILAIDIGNTTTNVGVFIKGTRLASQFAIATHPIRTPRRVAAHVHRLAARHRVRIDATTSVVLCSVVPRMSSIVVQALRSLGARRIAVVGKDVRVPLVNRYRYPRQVGQDRLVGAYAALREFNRNCIVADFGTAITIDVVTKKGEYLGGVIAPGIGISLEALATRTALLPRVQLKEPPELLGRDTANSIRAGLIYGCAALCDGVVTGLKQRYAPGAVVIATGGASPLIAKHARTINYLRPHLILSGLNRISQIV